ncbi:DUF262 domain-containing protein [Glutamicibacter ardleyensis]|uniref:DUF262 domain-containing protein n=1 Tax=Glutamicibacter ardleyensis TaxID=225894 RepID=UPI003FCFDE8F
MTAITVPKFQRSYAWTSQNVSEYWNDICNASEAERGYFMGTVVLAHDNNSSGEMLIVDGQQRITTTAILFIAIRDRLIDFELGEQWRAVQREYLSDYVLSQEAHKPKLTLNPIDAEDFELLLDVNGNHGKNTPVFDAYQLLSEKIRELTPEQSSYTKLINLVTYLSSSVQVLTATATDLSEAFVIFETLNDRGADLTTADLLKNFIFSRATGKSIRLVEESWIRLSGAFTKPADFVQFIRYEYMSRNGHVTVRNLYKAIQSDIPQRYDGIVEYLRTLEKALKIYKALKEPDDPFWSSNAVPVRDSLLAFRRLRVEVTNPLLLAAFTKWSTTNASKLVNTVANWSIRAWTSGALGGGTADSAFSKAAQAITSGEATTSADLLPLMEMVPDDAKFRTDFNELGDLSTTVAKYLLGRLEMQARIDLGQSTDAIPDWTSRSVTVEHIFAKSSKEADFPSKEEFENFVVIRDRLQNFTPFELTLNGDAKNSSFESKRPSYLASSFELTKEIGRVPEWTTGESTKRMEKLAKLAVKAWPL